MFMTRCTSKTEHPQVVVSTTRHAMYNIIFGASIAIASAALLTGCGQKGDLYLVDSGKAIGDSTAILDSGNNTQDTDDFQLPEPSSDPNDY
ncbi:putative small lipoprotein YifL [Psychrobacter luti]|uniref:Putative small lipoprotein YifL n=1 Tax=Psychrobacter luti TaxID=198481 RepID=A0A839TB13_9GAMM|nr:lipoprotein [Psychrobacter luti]MBB3106682.1 putative small lipoprotein YifL [Psychrobacter luti]